MDLAEEITQHLGWERPLTQLFPRSNDGLQSWLTYRIDVLIDFDWLKVIKHEAQTFKHYKSLSDYVRKHQERSGKHTVLVLTAQDGCPEGLDTSGDDHDIFVVNVIRYKNLRNADVASAYFARIGAVPGLQGSFISDPQLTALLESVKGRISLANWLKKNPDFAAIWPTQLDKTDAGGLTAALLSRLQNLNEDDRAHLESLLEADAFPSNLIEAAAFAHRKLAVATFKAELERDEWKETEDWQPFFQTNHWIFGHGLLYHLLNPVEGQVLTGGKDMSNKGGSVGDFAVRTSSLCASFLALVDIKTPSSQLLGPLYRNRCFGIHSELAGAVAQIQALCDRWNREGSKDEPNIRRAAIEGWDTAQPRGILIVGHTKQLDTQDKKRSFELFRRDLHGVEILTFDELYDRANALVEIRPSRDEAPDS